MAKKQTFTESSISSLSRPHHQPNSQMAQVRSAFCMYSERASNYEKSWHPEYSRRFMELVDIRVGDRVLDLACGTCLEAIIAAHRVGDEGLVVGVDITPNMLDIAKSKQTADPILSRRLKLVQHDIKDLRRCAGVEKDSFDLIICSNAFVLLGEPGKIIAHWREYLKPGGRLVVDIPHEKSLRSGVVLEEVAQRLGIPFPSHRLWIKSIDSFKELLWSQGFVLEKVETLENIIGWGTQFLAVDRADEQFDRPLNGPIAPVEIMNELKEKGRPFFKEAWEKAAVDGKVEVTDILYVYVASKI
jgi:ubiquinone/menaquinone biosynthesis C-methylase UbiE